MLPTCIDHARYGQRPANQTCRAPESALFISFRYTLAVVVSCGSHLKACTPVPTVVPTRLGLCSAPQPRQNRVLVIRPMMLVHPSGPLLRILPVLLRLFRAESPGCCYANYVSCRFYRKVCRNAALVCFLLRNRPFSIVVAITYFSLTFTMFVTLEALPSLVFGAVSPPSRNFGTPWVSSLSLITYLWL